MKHWKKNLVRAVLPFLLMVTASACTANRQCEPEPDAEPGSGSPAAGEAILTAIRGGDYPLFRKTCGDLYSAEEFAAARKSLTDSFGEIQQFRYLARLSAESLQDQVWLVSFTRKNSQGKTVRRDTLFRVVTGMEGDREKIVAFSFI